MVGEIVQVRDVPTEDVTELRTRAAARGVSLSQYLRELIHDEVSRPAMVDVVDRIAARTPIEVGSNDVRAHIADGRR
ncbi:hypothetical protein [Flexivirga caeni]|uniref:Antitoxin n=1 Tax=Flexivirga caeni TaxID=2294115 RepID=A0A3M9MC70_9MICO|nr:hypothetical protein [Flexivirga caeni]RNI23161.1 hypothetical protein EFY87_06895 [Flexivirga caeni]